MVPSKSNTTPNIDVPRLRDRGWGIGDRGWGESLSDFLRIPNPCFPIPAPPIPDPRIPDPNPPIPSYNPSTKEGLQCPALFAGCCVGRGRQLPKLLGRWGKNQVGIW